MGAMFHVKHWAVRAASLFDVSRETGVHLVASLLADAEAAEYLIQHILDIDPAGDAAECDGGAAQLLRAQFAVAGVTALKRLQLRQGRLQ